MPRKKEKTTERVTLPRDPVQLPIGPFRDWCDRVAKRYGGIAGLGRMAGYPGLDAVLREHRTVGFNLVDLVVTREGSLAGGWEIYGDEWPDE